MRAFEHTRGACVARLGRPKSKQYQHNSNFRSWLWIGEEKRKRQGKPTVVAILSDSIVYHVVTTEHATAGTSSKAPGEALSGQTLWERCGKFPVRAHVSSIVTDG